METEFADDAGEVIERHDGVVDVGRVAVAVTALVERQDVEVGLERKAQRVPRVRVAREAVEEQERRASLAAPVEEMQA